MRPLYKVWLEFTVWLGLAFYWLLLQQEVNLWWQPLLIWFALILLYFFTEHQGVSGYIIALPGFLVLVGWLFLYRLNPEWATRQFWGFLLASLAYIGGLMIPLFDFERPRYFAAGALLLLAVTLIFGYSSGGATAWLRLGKLSFQPVEVARILLIIYLARQLHSEGPSGERYLVLAGFFSLLVLQRDLGPLFLTFAVYSALVLYNRFSWGKVLVIAATGSLGFSLAYYLFHHLRNRVTAWLNPWQYPDAQGYQIVQGLFAIQAGGLTGKGLGRGIVRTIPAGHTDYLLAIIGEELGLLGTFSLVLIYLGMAFWAHLLLAKVENLEYRTIALGLTLLLHGQVFLVVGGILRLFPFTGLTLPFVSFGSSSLVAQFWLLGMLVSLGRNGREL